MDDFDDLELVELDLVDLLDVDAEDLEDDFLESLDEDFLLVLEEDDFDDLDLEECVDLLLPDEDSEAELFSATAVDAQVAHIKSAMMSIVSILMRLDFIFNPLDSTP